MLFCLLRPFLSNAQTDTLSRLTADQRVVALWVAAKVWAGDSIVARHRLDRVQLLARQRGDERLYWYAELHRIINRATLEVRAGKMATSFVTNELMMESCPEAVVRASYYCLYGQHCFQNRQFDKGFKLMFRARSMFEKIGYANIPDAAVYLSIYGHYYYSFEDYRKALYYLDLDRKYARKGLGLPYTNLNTVGMAHQRLGEYRQAEQAFQGVMRLAAAYHDTVYVGIGAGNLGNTLRLMGQNRQALPYLYADLAQNEHDVPENSAITCLYIAKALLALDSVAKAKTFIDRSTHLHPDRFWSSYPVNYYEVLTLYYKKTGNFARATAYLDSTVALKDSLRTVFSNRIVAAAESSVNAGQYLSDLQQVETDRKWAIRERNIMLTALLLLGIATGYAFHQNRQRLRQKQRVQAEQRERAEAQLAHAQAQLAQYLANVNEKNDLIGQISLELDKARQESPESELVRNNRLTALLDSVILTDTDWLRFRQLFEQVYPNFFDTLHQAHADLTPAEVRLLALLKLAIPTKQMAFMLGVSVESIHKSRYRLRKKLDSRPPVAAVQALIGSV